MTGLTPPAGVEASERPLDGCTAEWRVRGPENATYLEFRLWGPREEKVNRVGRVVQHGRPAYVAIRTGIISFGPDISDPEVLRRFGWRVLSATHRLAHVLEFGTGPAPAPELNPQTTVFDFAGDVIEVRTSVRSSRRIHQMNGATP